MIRQVVVINKPRIKADKTGTISAGTILELTKETDAYLNTLAYDKEEVFLIICKKEEFPDFIAKEAESMLGVIEKNYPDVIVKPNNDSDSK